MVRNLRLTAVLPGGLPIARHRKELTSRSPRERDPVALTGSISEKRFSKRHTASSRPRHRRIGRGLFGPASGPSDGSKTAERGLRVATTSLSRAGRGYVWAVVAAGGGIVIYSLIQLGLRPPRYHWFFGVYPGFPIRLGALPGFVVGDRMWKALWKLVENEQRFPRRGGRVLCVHGAVSFHRARPCGRPVCRPGRHEGSLEPYRQNCDESGLQISPPGPLRRHDLPDRGFLHRF